MKRGLSKVERPLSLTARSGARVSALLGHRPDPDDHLAAFEGVFGENAQAGRAFVPANAERAPVGWRVSQPFCGIGPIIMTIWRPSIFGKFSTLPI